MFSYIMNIDTITLRSTLTVLVVMNEFFKTDADPIFSSSSIGRDDEILSVGENYRLKCTGHSPLKWSYPNVENDIGKYTNISVNSNKDGQEFFSELYISNITYLYVGDYSCKEENATKNITWVYLYVNDSEHLLVLDDPDSQVYTVRYSVFTIPCKPTSPDVKIALEIPGRKVVFNQMDGNFIYLYDPHIGIITNDSILSIATTYDCIYEKGNYRKRQHIFVCIEEIASVIAQPAIRRAEYSSDEVGGAISLECNVKKGAEVQVTLYWTNPRGIKNETDGLQATLFFENITLADQGEYICNARDRQGHQSKASTYYRIYGKDEHFIKLTSVKSKTSSDQIEAGTHEVLWEVKMDAHPAPTITWINNKNQIIIDTNEKKYQIYESATKLTLTIKNITLFDYGKYILKAQNNRNDEKILEFFLNVTDEPYVQMDTNQSYQLHNEVVFVSCNVKANPAAEISWNFKPCLDDSCDYKKINIPPSSTQLGELDFSYEIKVTFNKSGIINCSADNSMGHGDIMKPIYVCDIANCFGIVVLNEDVSYNETDEDRTIILVAEGESLSLSCRAQLQNSQHEIRWSYHSDIINSSEKYRIQKNYSEFSNKTDLTIIKVSYRDNGFYKCTIYDNSDNNLMEKAIKEEYVEIIVSEPVPTSLNKTNMNETTELNIGEKLELICEFDGLPKPVVTWYKGDEPIFPSDHRPIITDNNGYKHALLKFNSTEERDEGTYKCVGKNRLNSKFAQTALSFKNKKSSGVYIIIIICLIIVLSIAVVIIWWKDSRKRKLEFKLKELGLAYFDKGQIENLNSELGIEDQAELLPYDRKWEFPIANLKLGKQLGAGAFGVVCKGQAKGIKPEEEITTVAVKMVKRNAEDSCMRALVSELKIMAHLGKHLNVLNLLGACTKNVTKKELLVIVEYCKYGNIHNYLYRNRKDFINQIDSVTGNLDWNIGIEKLERTLSIASSKSCSQMKYAEHFYLRKDSNRSLLTNSDKGNDNLSCTGTQTETTEVNMSPKVEDDTGDDYVVTSSAGSSIHLEWRTNYKPDYKGSVGPICTEDLIIWAFQVARGMEYLTSRKVLHGDLAARNILLTYDNVVKICDFGLAKNIYNNDQYKMKSNCPLPIKWMAIEAIRDRVFSTQSDVWAFGVVLWELFSLARMPYPGMEADERLYAKLVEGYRMESPEYATQEIYKVMLDCWSLNPLDRPSFTELHEKIGCMLEEGIKKHYLDLNNPYLQVNSENLQNCSEDYLSMLNSPDFSNLSSPNHYINEFNRTPGYLSMNSVGVPTPKISEGDIFTFDNNRIERNKSNGGSPSELAPILETNAKSLQESEECTENKTSELTNQPITITHMDLSTCSVSNPSYSIPPVISETVMDKKGLEVPSRTQKNIQNEKPAVTTRTSLENAYVNSNVRNWEDIGK